MSETRKLVAILVADVVGYSRLAGADEDRTLSRLRGLRSDLIDPAIAAHHGRIVKRTGKVREGAGEIGCPRRLRNGVEGCATSEHARASENRGWRSQRPEDRRAGSRKR